MPTISFFGPGIRPNRWMGLYDSIAQSGIDFDLSIVGPNEPDFTLPDNFVYIKSNVKPVQCMEAAFRLSEGDLIIPIADDEIFIDDAIAQVYRQYTEINDWKTIISHRYVLNGEDISEGALPAMRYYVWEPTSPLAPIAPIMNRRLWKELGGIDKRFCALYWDLDMWMRVYEYGGTGILHKTAKVEEVGISIGGGEHNLYNKYGPTYDRRILDSLWTLPPIGTGPIQKNRMSPLQPFEDKDILTVTQGVKGEWK